VRSPIENAVKLIAYQLGKRNAWLPGPVRRWCSMHPFHWRQQHAAGAPPGGP